MIENLKIFFIVLPIVLYAGYFLGLILMSDVEEFNFPLKTIFLLTLLPCKLFFQLLFDKSESKQQKRANLKNYIFLSDKSWFIAYELSEVGSIEQFTLDYFKLTLNRYINAFGSNKKKQH